MYWPLFCSIIQRESMKIWKQNELARVYTDVLHAADRFAVQQDFTSWNLLLETIERYNKLGGKACMGKSKLAVYYLFKDIN